MSEEIYFANKEGDDLLSELQTRKEMFYNYLRSCGLLDLWRRAYSQFFKANIHGGGIVRSGENGEYTGLYVNDSRNLMSQLGNITVSQRPAFQARATNTDYKSQAQAKLANGLLDYYMREKRLEKYVKKAVDQAVSTFGRGFISLFWDTDEGEEYGTTESGAIIKNGDIVFRNHNSSDIIRDPMAKSFGECDWYIIRTYQNKYNLAAKYPELADQIINLSYMTKDKLEDFFDYTMVSHYTATSDIIPVYEFFHKKTNAVPNGKYVLYLDNNILLIDSPLPYKDIPLYSVSTGEIHSTPFDYTVAYDLLPLQKMTDVLYSSAATNQTNGSVSNLLMPRGSNVGVEELTGGLNVVEYDPGLGIPQILNLTATPPEVFSMIDRLSEKGQMLSGINNVILGNPDPSLKSGAALALIASQAYSSNLPLQSSYVQMLEDLGTGIINVLKDFATVPRIAMIAGNANRAYMKEFKGDDLSQVNRVIVDIGNPVTNTIAGKLELANNIINMPPEFRDQYYTILQTGRYEAVMEGQSAEIMLIKAENEKLQNGLQTVALVTDNQELHIREHKVILSSPEARDNPDIVGVTLEHIQQHIGHLKNGDPDILGILGNRPLPQSQAMPNNQVMNNQPPVMNEAASVNMPNMPVNPMTNQEFSPPPIQ